MYYTLYEILFDTILAYCFNCAKETVHELDGHDGMYYCTHCCGKPYNPFEGE